LRSVGQRESLIIAEHRLHEAVADADANRSYEGKVVATEPRERSGLKIFPLLAQPSSLVRFFGEQG